jgi:Domain of unknown function (DUF4382)
MWFPRCDFRRKFVFEVILAALVVAGCGNSCFVATSNSGTGRVVVKAGDPPPTCSLSMGMGMMGAMAVKSVGCTNCTAAARVEHVLVTVRGVQVRATNGRNGGDWIELAPRLVNQARQMDLMGNEKAEILADGTSVPAGSYREVRVQFVTAASDGEELRSGNLCGTRQGNCVVRGNGSVEGLGLAGGAEEIVIPFESSVVVLPDGKVDLEIRLEPRQEFSPSGTDGLKMRNVLVGSARGVRGDSRMD